MTALPAEAPWTVEVLGAPAVEFAVPGIPAPQGSKVAGVRRNGTGYVREASKKLMPWRDLVTLYARCALPRGWQALDDDRHGVIVDLIFTMPRPTSTPKRGRSRPAKKPDIDKLARACLDSLTVAKVFKDDGRVVAFRRLEAVYAGDPDPDAIPDGNTGVVIRVWPTPIEGAP